LTKKNKNDEFVLPNSPGFVLLKNLGLCVVVLSAKEGM